MMYLIPDPVATTQLSGIAESSPARPSPSKSSYQNGGEKSSPCLLSYASPHRRRYYSSDDEDEDDGRDRQSHWKRIKTRADDHPRGSGRTLIRYTEPSYEKSPPRIRLQAPPQSPKAKPKPKARRVIVLNGSGHESEGRSGSGSKGWDGGAAVKQDRIDSLGGSKRKQELMSAFGHASRSPLMMSERSMVVREKLTARRVPVESGYEVRVSGREVGEFVYGEEEEDDDDDDYEGFLVEDSCEGEDARARIGSDLREFLNRRSRAEEAMSREESRGYGDHRIERVSSDVGLRVRRAEFDAAVKVQGSALRKALDLGRAFRSGNGDWKERCAGSASVGAKSRRDIELERRQEKRERWAEKERDLEKELEKENVRTSTLLPPPPKEKSVMVVDYSHKFTLAKAPISAPTKLVEGDPHRLCQRQKQIDYGKNTLGYERYTNMIPRYQRTKAHPRTPDIRQVCSKRSWDGQIRKWRRLLHEFDPPKGEDEEDPDQMLAPRRQQEIHCATDDDGLMDMQREDVEDPDMKIYEGWSDDDC